MGLPLLGFAPHQNFPPLENKRKSCQNQVDECITAHSVIFWTRSPCCFLSNSQSQSESSDKYWEIVLRTMYNIIMQNIYSTNLSSYDFKSSLQHNLNNSDDNFYFQLCHVTLLDLVEIACVKFKIIYECLQDIYQLRVCTKSGSVHKF